MVFINDVIYELMLADKLNFALHRIMLENA